MAAAERRVDPEDGAAYTLEELVGYYKGKFKRREVQDYWDKECKPLGTRARAKGRAAGRPKAGPADAAPAEVPRRPGRSEAMVATMARRDADWRIGSVVYQVFVDRFAPPSDLEKRKALFPAPCTLHEWTEVPRRGELNSEVGYWGHELQFWGGDLASLAGKLEYLKDLGVDVLYLQPICSAFSNHKYDATDYLAVDPQYGSVEDFTALADAVHAKDMRLVLDGVFNHMGRRSPIFQEALKDSSSSRKQWFYLGDEYPRGYKNWGGAENLVELQLETASVQDYLWKGKESVVATWLKRGADGWRLDVAQEVGFDLLKALTAAAHRHKKGSLVVGEVWAYPPRWTSVMDGVLNLHLGVLIRGVAEGACPGPTAAQSVADLIADSSMEEVLRSWIVLSNHDMPRLAHRLPAIATRQFAVGLQFTLPGCPMVYYGDELGMDGGDDPDNRAPFRWQDVTDENGMLAHMRKLIGIRKRLRALRIGNYRALPSQRLLAFVRMTDRVMDTVIVLANAGPTAKEMVTVPDPRILGYTLFRDELSGEETRILGATLTVEVPAMSIRIFSMVDESSNPSGAQYKRIYGHWASFPGLAP